MKVSEGRKAWVKNPEKLKNCSTGFHFPQQADESGQIPVQVNITAPHIDFLLSCYNFLVNREIKMWMMQEERVQMMKLVRFYRVEL